MRQDTPLVDDDILNDILRKELGAETEGIRMRVDEEGLEYLEAEDPNEIRQDYTKGSRYVLISCYVKKNVPENNFYPIATYLPLK